MSGPSDSPASAPAPERPKVLYIMGQGKSGSTILGIALGNCEGVFFAGELTSWLMTSGRPIFGGRERTRFWRGVREELPDAEDLFGGEAFHHLERSMAAVRREDEHTRSLRERYRAVTGGLYGAIARRSGAQVVVDSSHLPLRARELQSVEAIELYLVFLVRSPESVVASHTRHVSSRAVAERRWRAIVVSFHMWVTYLLSASVFLRQPRERRLLVHHEDFVADPRGFLREILDFLGCEAELPDLSALRTGVPFQGNSGLLREEVVALQARPAAAHHSSRLLALARRPMMLLLGALRPVATGGRGGAS